MAFERKKKVVLNLAPEAGPPAEPSAPVAVVQLTNTLRVQCDRADAVLAQIERVGRYEHATISELKSVLAEFRKLA